MADITKIKVGNTTYDITLPYDDTLETNSVNVADTYTINGYDLADLFAEKHHSVCTLPPYLGKYDTTRPYLYLNPTIYTYNTAVSSVYDLCFDFKGSSSYISAVIYNFDYKCVLPKKSARLREAGFTLVIQNAGSSWTSFSDYDTIVIHYADGTEEAYTGYGMCGTYNNVEYFRWGEQQRPYTRFYTTDVPLLFSVFDCGPYGSAGLFKDSKEGAADFKLPNNWNSSSGTNHLYESVYMCARFYLIGNTTLKVLGSNG